MTKELFETPEFINSIILKMLSYNKFNSAFVNDYLLFKNYLNNDKKKNN